jgi:hypothetical protein
VQRDEHLMAWFAKLSTTVSELNYERPIVAGRTINAVIQALENVETFESISTRFGNYAHTWIWTHDASADS